MTTPTPIADVADQVLERWCAAGHPVIELRWWGHVGGSADVAAAALRTPDARARLVAVLDALAALAALDREATG
jgi:hypothetical protein